MPKKGGPATRGGDESPAPSTPGGEFQSPGLGPGTQAILAALGGLEARITASEARLDRRLDALEQPATAIAAALANDQAADEGQGVRPAVERARVAPAGDAGGGGGGGGGGDEDPDRPGQGGGGGGGGAPDPAAFQPLGVGQRLGDLTVEQLQTLIVASVGDAAAGGVGGQRYVADSIPWLEEGLALPRRFFAAQDRGEIVPLNLLTRTEYGNLITGYTTLPEGSQAELDYGYVISARQHAVLAHLDKCIDGSAAVDLPRLREVINEIAVLGDERTKLLIKRAFVKGTPQDDHKWETDAKIVQALKDKRAGRRRPAEVDKDDATDLERAIEQQFVKQVAITEARARLKLSGLGKPGKGPKGGGGAGGADAPD
jgi:hypothetical protein